MDNSSDTPSVVDVAIRESEFNIKLTAPKQEVLVNRNEFSNIHPRYIEIKYVARKQNLKH